MKKILFVFLLLVGCAESIKMPEQHATDASIHRIDANGLGLNYHRDCGRN